MRSLNLKHRRKFWLKAHLWMGLGLGLFLSIFGITGSVLVFHSEIDHWLNPQLHTAVKPEGEERKSLQQIFAAAEKAAPQGWESAGAAIPESPDENFVFGYWVDKGTPAPEDAVALDIAINPYTAEPVARRVFYHAWNPLKHCLTGFFFKLHYALLFAEHFDNAGNIVVGVMALLLCITVLIGLILWWPLDGRWRRVLGIKKHAGTARFNHDLHQAAGFYILVVLLAVLVSGVYFNLPDQFRWVVGSVSPLSAEPVSAPKVTRAQAIDIDLMLGEARQQYPGGRLSYLTLPNPKSGLVTACFENVPELAGYVIDNRCLILDSCSGKVIQTVDPAHGSAGDVFMQWQWPLHSGQAFGWPGRILVFISGLICPLLFVTGLIRWMQKRRSAAFEATRKQSITASCREGSPGLDAR